MKSTPPPVQTHAYIQGESNHAALNPEFLCATCGYPKRNRRHDLPAVPASVLAEEARSSGPQTGPSVPASDLHGRATPTTAPPEHEGRNGLLARRHL